MAPSGMMNKAYLAKHSTLTSWLDAVKCHLRVGHTNQINFCDEAFRYKNWFCGFQQLETLSFNRTGSEFISCHTDGSYIIWTLDKPDYPKESASTPYGKWKILVMLCYLNSNHLQACIPAHMFYLVYLDFQFTNIVFYFRLF